MKINQLPLILLVALASGLVGGIVSDKLAAANTPKILSVHQLRIIDAQGRVRATFGVNEKGASVDAESFRLIDKKKQVRGGLGIASDDTASLILIDKDFNRSIKMLVGSSANVLLMGDKSMEYRAGILAGEGDTALFLMDKKGSCGIKVDGIRMSKSNGEKVFVAP